MTSRRIILPLLLLAMLGLLSGLWSGLLRLGWALPDPFPALAINHGALMISAFLGALISLERAAAVEMRWAYAAPLLAALGGASLIVGAPTIVGAGLMVAGSTVLVLLFVVMLRRQISQPYTVMAIGAALWWAGNLLWWLGWPLFRIAPWWLGFLVLTVAGERLELGRVMRHRRSVSAAFGFAVCIFAAGLLVGLVDATLGIRIGGAGLLALGAWLLHYDIARRTIQKAGLTRFVAACLLAGFFWLILAGALWLVLAPQFVAGPAYDAMLHAVLVGFVISMIFGHAPIILPALLRIEVRYTPWLYLPFVLLHTALVARLWGDLSANFQARLWGGLLNEVAMLLFASIAVAAMARGRTSHG